MCMLWKSKLQSLSKSGLGLVWKFGGSNADPGIKSDDIERSLLENNSLICVCATACPIINV